MAAISEAITQLDAIIAQLRLEKGRGVKKVSHNEASIVQRVPSGVSSESEKKDGPATIAKPKKEKAVKKPEGSAINGPAPDSGPALFARAQLQIVKILSVDEINSDKLYKTSVDLGGGQTRQVLAGLKGHIQREALQGSLAVAILNLKPARLAGEASEAMLLAADAPKEGGGELVRLLIPPEGSEAGDMVYLKGSSPSSEYQKTLKSDPWKKIVAGLSVQKGHATFEGQALVTARGPVLLPPEMPDGAGIH